MATPHVDSERLWGTVTHALLDHPRPLGFAHRGGARLFPENTLLAFERALGLGPLALELDVRVTRDGHLVVLHDETVDRTTNGSGPVAALSLSRLQTLDAGYHFTDATGFPFRGAGLTVPTFDELVRALPGAAFNVDLKVTEATKPLLDAIRRHQLEDRIVVASHAHRVIAAFRRLAPDVATSASRSEALCWRAAALLGRAVARPPYRALQLPRDYSHVPILTRRSVALAHRAGLLVHAWTIDQPHVMRELLDIGVDGIMSDRPDILARVLATAVGNP
jgi:glycerophosphoryl diester phosphodiesterase